MAVALPFTPAYIEGGGTPSTLHYAVFSGEDFVRGAPMTINGNAVDELDTADVTLIVGVAAAADASAFGYDMADSPTVITGRENTVPVWIANRSTVFYGQISTGATVVAPAASDVGVSYGVVRQSDGTWTVNRSDTTTVTVKVTKIDTSLDSPGRVYFKFLASATIN